MISSGPMQQFQELRGRRAEQHKKCHSTNQAGQFTFGNGMRLCLGLVFTDLIIHRGSNLLLPGPRLWMPRISTSPDLKRGSQAPMRLSLSDETVELPAQIVGKSSNSTKTVEEEFRFPDQEILISKTPQRAGCRAWSSLCFNPDLVSCAG